MYYLPYSYMAVVLSAQWLHVRCIMCPVATWRLYYLPNGYVARVLPVLWLHSRYITCPMAT